MNKQTNLQKQQQPNVGIPDHGHLWKGEILRALVPIVEQKILQNIFHYQILLKQYISTLHKKFCQ